MNRDGRGRMCAARAARPARVAERGLSAGLSAIAAKIILRSWRFVPIESIGSQQSLVAALHLNGGAHPGLWFHEGEIPKPLDLPRN
jgi:hypothetical protein